jgi:hypothetical protein
MKMKERKIIQIKFLLARPLCELDERKKQNFFGKTKLESVKSKMNLMIFCEIILV